MSCDWLLLGEEGAREAPPARCGSCGAIVTGLDRYCPQCGHPLQKEEADTYSLVLVDPRKNLTAAFDALAWLSRRPWCAPEFPICRRSQEELEALQACQKALLLGFRPGTELPHHNMADHLRPFWRCTPQFRGPESRWPG